MAPARSLQARHAPGMSGSEFDPLLAFRVLTRHSVRFVVIGGYAASLRGSPVVTGDLDVCYARDEENHERLAAALRELRARLRGPGVPDDIPFILDAETIRTGDHFTFATDGGSLDCMGTPAGTTGFADLDARADTVQLDGMEVRVASVDDLIRMKEAAAREKDRSHLIHLRALRQEIERGES
jgi:hypothetical protein